MRIEFVLEAADCRVWLRGLLRALEAAGVAAGFAIRPGAAGIEAGVEGVLRLERRLFGLAGPSPWDRLDPAELPQAAGVGAARISLSAPSGEIDGLMLLVGALRGVGALPGALMAGAPFTLSLVEADGKVQASAVPALSDPDSLWRSLEEVSRRLATLCRAALDGQGAHRLVPSLPQAVAPGHPFGFVTRALVRKFLGRLSPARHRADHWRIGLRARGGDFGTLKGFQWLPDDGQRFYADPHLVERDGRCWLFLEEFPYSTARGVIALAEIGPQGQPLAVPRVILERPGHLSFPQVFEAGGETYLALENAAEGHVPLYRARRFPDQWEEVEPLLREAVHDPVLVESAGRHWILGNLALEDGSPSDALCAWSAPHPLGPYTPHPANPLMLDARFARAGGLLLPDRPPLRVMQDCTRGYGRALAFADLLSLDEAGMRLGPIRRWCPPGGALAGLHSYSRSARFEAIDLLTPRAVMPA